MRRMMIQSLKNHLVNLPGWRTHRKIVVFESDDWGAIRTSSNQALAILRKEGIAVDRCHYMLNDSLASEEDLTYLFETLQQHKDSTNRSPVLTANCLVANPDFQRIAESDFQNYYWEPLPESLQRYPQHAKAFALWNEGMAAGLFHPQSHGREHLNVSRWMAALQVGDPYAHLAFQQGMYGVSVHTLPRKRGSFMAAFDGAGGELTYNRAIIVQEGLDWFERLFGYRSASFIAPNYVWDGEIEEAIAQRGVLYIQGARTQQLSGKAGGPVRGINHFQGQKNRRHQYYLVRNAHFEPASEPGKDWVSSCLREIQIAFHWHKPAIISTHRVNFVGFLSPQNRDQNLKQFDQLLRAITTRWPGVVFLSSDQLGNLIRGERDVI